MDEYNNQNLDEIVKLLSSSDKPIQETIFLLSQWISANLPNGGCQLFAFDPSNNALLPTLTASKTAQFSWSDFPRPDIDCDFWDLSKQGIAKILLDQQSVTTEKTGIWASVTSSPDKSENGLFVFWGEMPESAFFQNPLLLSMLNFRLGKLIEDQLRQKNSHLSVPENSYLSQAIDVINDSYIIYDADNRVVSFSPQHLEYYPWLAGHLEQGAAFEDLARYVAYSGKITGLEGQEEEWIAHRLDTLKHNMLPMDTTLDDDRVIRIKETLLPNGGRATALTDITAFKKREQEYRNLLEASPDAIFIMIEERLAYVNKQMLRLFQASSSEDLIGQSAASIIHSDDLYLLSKYSLADVEGKDDPLEVRLMRLDGTSFYGDFTAGTINWNGNRATLCTIRDVSARKEMIEKLALREREMAAAQMLANSGYWTLNIARQEIELSIELCQMFDIDISRRKMPLEDLKEWYPEDVFETTREAFSKCIKSKEAFNFEHPLLVDGNWRHIRARGQAIYDENDRATEIFGVSRDATDQKMVERALIENEQRFRDLTQASSDLYWEIDADLKFTFISQVVESVVGRQQSHYLGHTVEEIFADGIGSSKVLADIISSMKRQEVFKDQKFSRWNPVERRTIWIRCSGIPFYDEDGTFCGYRGSNTDITKQIELEEQLKQSQKMEAIGQLTGGIAHDFNNLLAVIQGNTELLQENPEFFENDKHRLKLEAVSRAAEKGADLTHRMLAYSRKQTLNPTIVDLRDQVSNMLSILRRTVGQDIEFDVKHASDLWTTLIDANQIDNALLNLVLNARDAMQDGGTLQISSENFRQNTDQLPDGTKLGAGPYVCLAIKDTGAGIPKENLEFVFDPFFTTKDIGKGTGLGLSVVFGFVKQSNGAATITSTVGEGTVVSLYLPAHI